MFKTALFATFAFSASACYGGINPYDYAAQVEQQGNDSTSVSTTAAPTTDASPQKVSGVQTYEFRFEGVTGQEGAEMFCQDAQQGESWTCHQATETVLTCQVTLVPNCDSYCSVGLIQSSTQELPSRNADDTCTSPTFTVTNVGTDNILTPNEVVVRLNRSGTDCSYFVYQGAGS